MSGSLTVVGSGTTYILAKWGDGDWTQIAAFDGDSASTSFSSSYTGGWGESITGYLICSNECHLADGTLAEAPYVTTWNQAFSPIDDTTYTWQAVDGDWNGDWSDASHWASDKADCIGYPNNTSATASFLNCTLGNPVTVAIDGIFSFKALNLFDADAGNLSFVGTGTSESSLTVADEIFIVVKNKGYMPSDSSVLFKDMTLNSSGQQLNFAMDENNTQTNISVEFSGAAVNAKVIWLRANESSISFRNGTTVTLTEKLSVGGTNTVVTIDDSTVTTPSVYAGDNRDSTGLKFRFEGSAPRINVNTSFQTYDRADTITLEFAVPIGGYSAAPINKTGVAFATVIGAKTPGYFTFAVADDSRALKKSTELLENQVLVQTANGFVMDYIDEDIGTVPEYGGESCGAFAWGVNGLPLAEGAELSTARQILLDLKGYDKSNGIMFLIY